MHSCSIEKPPKAKLQVFTNFEELALDFSVFGMKVIGYKYSFVAFDYCSPVNMTFSTSSKDPGAVPQAVSRGLRADLVFPWLQLG